MQRHTWNVFSLPICLLYTWLFEAIQFINYYHNSLQFVLSINMNQNDNMIFSKKPCILNRIQREKAQKKISTHHWNRMGLMENIFQMVNLLLCWFSWKVRKIENRKMWWSMKFVRKTEKKESNCDFCSLAILPCRSNQFSGILIFSFANRWIFAVSLNANTQSYKVNARILRTRLNFNSVVMLTLQCTSI